jgi:large subunit ribosomal protein L15
MQIHEINYIKKNKSKKRVGRGGKKGTYSGRGMKGQKSRAGHKKAPVIRELLKKYHKLKGYKFSTIKKSIAVVNLSDINKNFKKDEIVSPKLLVEKKLIKKNISSVKILGKGELKNPITVKGCLLSKSVIKKIEEANGKIIK